VTGLERALRDGMRITIVHNPAAGDEHVTADDLCGVLRDAGHEPSYASARDPAWRDAVRAADDIVLAAGGDGTASAVARELLHRDVALAVLPLGIANNVAEALAVRGPWRRVLQELGGWQRARCDVGVAAGPWGERPFLEAMGFGLFAQSMARARGDDPGRSPGRDVELARDVAQLRALLGEVRPVHCRITADGRTMDEEATLVAVMNTATIGPQLPLSRDGGLDDGVLHVVIVRHGDHEQLDRALRMRLQGEWPELQLEEVPARHIDVEWHGSAAHVDDQLVQGGAMPIRATATLLPGALRVLAPAPADVPAR
jgi:diacylglycerol kinase (ATP)